MIIKKKRKPNDKRRRAARRRCAKYWRKEYFKIFEKYESTKESVEFYKETLNEAAKEHVEDCVLYFSILRRFMSDEQIIEEIQRKS